MKRKTPVLLLAALALAALIAGCGGGGGDGEPTQTPGAPESTAAPEPTATPAPEPTATPAPTAEEPDPDTPDTPSYADTATVLEEILAGANDMLADDDKLGMTFTDPVTADNSQGMLGLSAVDFDEYVVSAYTSNAAIISIAHEVALIECEDEDAAAKVKELVAGGFDSLRWICVYPEHSLVISSGRYVMLAATRDSFSNAAVASFTAYMGGAGDPEVFYAGPEQGR
jgi:hypothetical protein